MLRLFVLVLLWILLAPSAAAQPDSVAEAFRAGNEAYEQRQYGRAVDAYRSVLDAGYASAELYYNLGNAHFRSGEVGQAIRYYEKARRLRPDDARIRHNLHQAREHVPGGSVSSPAPAWVRFADGWSPLFLFVVALCLVAAGGAMAVARSRSSPAGSVWSHPAVAGLLVTGVLVAGMAMGVSYLQSMDRRAVVLADRAPVRSVPQSDAPPDTTLPEGVLLTIRGERTDRQTTWTQVRLPDGTTGWLPSSSLGRID